MNIREKAIEYIRNNPGSSARQIAMGAGISHRMILPVLTELFITDVVSRAACGKNPYAYRLAVKTDIALLNAEYEKLRQQAENLEEKGLWRRAADVWLLAMDATRNEAARIKATERRRRCFTYSCITHNYSEGSSISSASVPQLDTWRDF